MEIAFVVFASLLIVSGFIGWYSYWKMISTIIKQKYNKYPFGSTYLFYFFKTFNKELADLIKDEGIEYSILEKYVTLFTYTKKINMIFIAIFVLFTMSLVILGK